MDNDNTKAWNPYLAGAAAGVAAVLSVLFAGKFFGTSTTFVNSAGIIEAFFDPGRTAQTEYFVKHSPKVDWQFMFVVGIVVGSFVSAWFSKTFKWCAVPKMWEERFGPSVLKRAAAAFAGGFVAILGARIAGGCPSGHGLSGMMQLAASGFLSLAFFFIAGFVVAKMLYTAKKA